MRYEYIVVNMVSSKQRGAVALERHLNKIGGEGWELAAIEGDYYTSSRSE